MSHPLKRHFATLDGRWGPRQVHYRRAGAGPVVLLLHQSPQSSREMVPLMQRWGAHFTVIAPDTPGYGQSDPLGPPQLTMEDFAAAVLEFADAVGARRFGVYGFHTGASIGVALASRHPDRVTAVAANGLVVLTAEERRRLLANYLPAIVPQWDGSHLAWLWARLREQAVFFPWYERTLASRMEFDMPSPDGLQASLLDFLRADDHYAIAYRAAFSYPTERPLADLRVPTLVTAAAADPLHAHLARIGVTSRDVEVRPSLTSAEALDQALHHLLAHRGDTGPAPVATRPVAGRLWNQMIHTPSGQLRARMALADGGRPVVALHDAGGSADALDVLLGSCVGQRPVLALDLPGHGESDSPARPAGPTVVDCAGVVREVLGAVGLRDGVIIGAGAGALVSLEVARHDPVHRLPCGLIDLPFLSDELRQAFRNEGLPSTEPVWHGGHLLLCWHLLRDGRLFFPWFRRDRAGIRRIEPDLDERALQLELRDLLKASGSWQRLLVDVLDYPLAAVLHRQPGAIVLGTAPGSAWHAATRAAARELPGLRLIELPAAPGGWLPALLSGL